MLQSAHLTTTLVWMCTAILAILDVILSWWAWRSVSHVQFERLTRLLSLASGVFFLLLWTSVLIWGWDWFYAYIFPGWARILLPPVFGIGYALLAMGMAWLSLKIRGSPAVTWCILGGIEGLLSHVYAIYGLGAASNPPIMQGTDPIAVLIFAVFEKAFYWSLILLTCRFLSVRKFLRARFAEPG